LNNRIPFWAQLARTAALAMSYCSRRSDDRYSLHRYRGGRIYLPLGDSHRMREKLYGTYEFWKTRLVERIVHEGMTILDVGANVGYYTLLTARLVGPTGRVLAFEPHPEVLHWLSRSVNANGYDNAELFSCALSDASGTVEFYPGRHSGWGSTLFHPESANQRLKPFAVEARTLDDVLNGLGVDRVDLIKVDVEGTEAKVLAGARRTLRDLSPMMLVDVDLRDRKAVARIHGLLADAGYDCYAIDRGLTPLNEVPPNLKDIFAARSRSPHTPERTSQAI